MKGPERPCSIKPQQTSSRNVLQRPVEPAALVGRRKRTQQCLLLREERTRAGRYSTSANDPHVWSGRALQEVSSTWQMRSCINVSGLWLERVVLRAIMDISAHSS